VNALKYLIGGYTMKSSLYAHLNVSLYSISCIIIQLFLHFSVTCLVIHLQVYYMVDLSNNGQLLNFSGCGINFVLNYFLFPFLLLFIPR
jgi:hypothetical protein